MVFQICAVAAIALLGWLSWVSWRRIEVLLSAVAKLSNALAEQQKFIETSFKDFDGENELIEKRITKVEEQVAELPVEKFREIAEKEADFVDGLNNILNYSVDNYGLNKDGVKHE